MSIAPPSDVVLDVAQAADPQKVRAATARLVRLGAGAGGDFAAELATTAGTAATTSRTAVLAAADGNRIETHKTSPYEKFEAMMLQNFIEEILPKDSELFGDESSAGPYRSMMADQLATQLAKTGRFGVAQSIEHAEARHANAASQAQPPRPPGGDVGVTDAAQPTI